jgi:hypothetical protein
MKTTKGQGRRPMPKMRTRNPIAVERAPLTVGDLISAAYDTLHETGVVLRVLGSHRMAEQIGRKLVFL